MLFLSSLANVISTCYGWANHSRSKANLSISCEVSMHTIETFTFEMLHNREIESDVTNTGKSGKNWKHHIIVDCDRLSLLHLSKMQW